MSDLQNTPEWYQARLGKLTASRYGDAMTKIKTGWGAERARYRAELVYERLNETQYPSYQSADMRWGTETQPEALRAYKFLRDADIEEVGFIPHPSVPMAGASPDGLIGSSGLVEVKCPASHTHISYVLERAPIPLVNIMQMQWQMICTGRSWCDWVSFDPRMKRPELQLEIRRVTIVEDAVVRTMEREAEQFVAEVEGLYQLGLARIQQLLEAA